MVMKNLLVSDHSEQDMLRQTLTYTDFLQVKNKHVTKLCSKIFKTSMEQHPALPSIMAEWLPLCFIFGRSQIQISAQKLATLTDVFHSLPQFLKANDGKYLKLGHNHFLPYPFLFII
jgi:hypothetical protein